MAHTTTPKVDPEIAKLRMSIKNIDCMSQDGFSAISMIAKLLLERLETPAGHKSMDDVATALELIWNKAEEIKDQINSEAENVACNYTDEHKSRRWDASRQAREAREGVQHG